MSQLLFLKGLREVLMNPNPDSLKLSLADTHHEGVFSLVIHGTEFGKLSRVFIATKRIKPYAVQMHTHRYPLNLTVLKGQITHHRAEVFNRDSQGEIRLPLFNYKSPLNNGAGLTYLRMVKCTLKDFVLPVGSSLHLGVSDFHTMSCSKGSIWVVEEQGFMVDESQVLGTPFITDGLYNAPKSFQINDKVQQVLKTVNQLINLYSTE